MDNKIHAIKLNHHSKEYEQAKHTLKTAFPKKEQSPLWVLNLFAKHQGVDFLSFYDEEDKYIGVSFSIHIDNKLLILYLAVDESRRSHGFGSKIIKYLQDKDNITETVLDIESPYEECDNKDERVGRFRFYEHLGFVSSNEEIVEPKCRYLILGTNKESAVETYIELSNKMSGGLYKLNIKKIN